MISVEVCDEARVHDVSGRYTLSLLGSVTLPVNYILSALDPAAYRQESLDLIDWTSFSELGWWWGHSGRNHCALLDSFNLTYMEGQVYS